MFVRARLLRCDSTADCIGQRFTSQQNVTWPEILLYTYSSYFQHQSLLLWYHHWSIIYQYGRGGHRFVMVELANVGSCFMHVFPVALDTAGIVIKQQYFNRMAIVDEAKRWPGGVRSDAGIMMTRWVFFQLTTTVSHTANVANTTWWSELSNIGKESRSNLAKETIGAKSWSATGCGSTPASVVGSQPAFYT